MNEKREKLLLQCISERNPVELAIGFLRYEALRKLRSHQFKQLCERNLSGVFFDDMVDELIEKD